MIGKLYRAVACAAVLAGAVAADPPPEGVTGAADKGEKKPAPLPTPAGAVLAVYESAADALRLMPKAVVLTPEKYQELLDEIARLRGLAERAKALTPSKCLLKGKVEGNVVRLRAEFDFATDRPEALVRLGCGLGLPTGVSLGGRTPRLLSGKAGPRPREAGEPEGFAVRVDKAGDHHLTLDLLVPVTDAAGQGFRLDLPRAAITSLELELPAGAKDVRVGGATLKPAAEALLALKGSRLAGDLGPADRLEVRWASAKGGLGGAAVEAVGSVKVRVDGREVATDALLTLRPLGGAADVWRLLVPLKAEVKVEPADDARAVKEEVTDLKGVSLRTLRLKAPSADPLTVRVLARVPLAKGAERTPVGPFTLVGAARQSGTVVVSNTAPDLHLDFHPHGDLKRRPVTDEELRRDPALVAAFRYGSVSAKGPPAGAPYQGPATGLAWLDLEAETVRGQLTTRLTHSLTLEADGGAPRWRVKTAVLGTPRWVDVDRLQVLLPPGCEWSEEGSHPLPEKVRGVSFDKATRVVEFRLARGGAEAPLKPFTVTVEALYPPAEGDGAPAGRAVLALPRPLDTLDQGGEVAVSAPRDVELVPTDRPPAPGLELLRQSTHELAWRGARRLPEGVEVVWRRWRPEVRLEATADLTLAGAQGAVRHELRLRFPQPAPPQLTLRVPPAVGGSLRVVEGGRLAGAPAGAPGRRLVNLTAPKGQAHTLVLDYAFPLGAADDGAFAVPLVAPEGVTRGETKVRVWGESGVAAATPPGAWAELNVEEVPGEARLPVLVLRGGRPDLPLRLRLGAAGEAFSVLVERALIQAAVGEGRSQTYRVRYRLSRLGARHLDVELPAPVPTLDLRVSLDGKAVDVEVLGEDGRRSDGGRVARLRLAPGLVRRGSVLEVAYALPAGRLAGGPLRTTLQPPVLRNAPEGVPTRWQVGLPEGWVPVGPESGPAAERTWGWRGWLLAPRLAVTAADLERWFAGGDAAAAGESAAPSLVCWRDGPEPLVVTHVPKQAWLLACSLGLLAVGLGLTWLTWPAAGRPFAAGWLWPALALLGVGVVAAALVWPTALSWVAYGCQPGAAVLVLVAGVQWLLHERYRRRVIFLPSFSRPRAGSSLVRQPEAPREPSTVDVPRPAGSSVERGARVPT